MTEENCGTCKWGELTGIGLIYCTVNQYWYSYSPPDSDCDCLDLAGSQVRRYKRKGKTAE